jgi:hypothetical protein
MRACWRSSLNHLGCVPESACLDFLLTVLSSSIVQAHNTYVEKTGDSNKKFKVQPVVWLLRLHVLAALLTVALSPNAQELEEEDANLSRQIARRKGYIERRTELVASWQSKLQRNSKVRCWLPSDPPSLLAYWASRFCAQECKQRNKGMREQVDGIRKQSNSACSQLACMLRCSRPCVQCSRSV